MKKNIFLIIIFIVLNGCAQPYGSIVGPTYTMAKTGSPMLSGASAATSYGIKKTTGYSPGEYINSLVKNNSFLNEKENLRECQTIHTSSLSKIFFETLDEIDCFQDPFSILK